MKKKAILVLMLFPVLDICGMLNPRMESVDGILPFSQNEVLVNPLEGISANEAFLASEGQRPLKTYLKWDWLTWNAENRMFITLMAGAGIFQHDRIFQSNVPNSNMWGLRWAPAFGVAFGYRFDPYWTFRAKYMNTTAHYVSMRNKSGQVSINSLSFNACFDLIKAFAPYNNGKNTLSPYVGFGLLVPNSYVKTPVTMNLGLSYVCNLTDRVSLSCDAEMLMVFGVENKHPRYPLPFNFQGSIMAGVSYRF